ncbi:WAS/WASL-interacting protein family member 3-like [Manis pentadactyla]|uniref:WAS/WASL-interacting protein family member 3-like n=1 Tax=Manis pentadactyla TaxID=143292 RepID=UPI00255CB01B|nr:WAS/WASL-interacting protein family member 3-like [Manis pentadactyla]
MPAGRGRTLTSERIRSSRRAANAGAEGAARTPRAPKGSPFRPRGRELCALPRVPLRRGRRALAPPPPGYPDFGPSPASAARPPRPAPDPPWRQRSVTAPLLSCLRSAPCQGGEAVLHLQGQGPRPSAGRRGSEGRTARRRGPEGRRGGGEVARTGCGRGGEPHSGSHRLLPAAASTFCTAQSGAYPRCSGSCHGLRSGGRAAELGAGSPKQPAPQRAEANLAARPAPQPFSRGSGRGGGCGGGSCSCCPCSSACRFPCARRTACLASASPPPKLPTAPGPQAAARAAPAAPSIHSPPLPFSPPTNCRVSARCQLPCPPPHRPPWAPVRAAPLPAAAAAAAAVPAPGSPLVQFTATIHQITSC